MSLLNGASAPLPIKTAAGLIRIKPRLRASH
jgi:hypothetical protein